LAQARFPLESVSPAKKNKKLAKDRESGELCRQIAIPFFLEQPQIAIPHSLVAPAATKTERSENPRTLQKTIIPIRDNGYGKRQAVRRNRHREEL
jgi:hypothetical protein